MSILFFVFSSCEKQEEAVEPFNRGDLTFQSISTGEDGSYVNQVYFNLNENKIVKTVSRESWDLAFVSDNQSNQVKLNLANKMFAVNMNTTDFDSFTTFSAPDEADKLYDYPVKTYKNYAITSLNIDNGDVFVVDRGLNASIRGGIPTQRGYKKIKVLAVTSTYYVVQHADIDGANNSIDTVYRDNKVNNVCFSLSNGGEVVAIEPDKSTWDLLFTQYTKEVFSVDFQLAEIYSVNGVLINENSVLGAKVFDKAFEDITIDDAASYTLADTIDVIGFDWKFFNLDNNEYTITANQNYILKGSQGFFYKLRFVDFYNELGVRGTPSFEFAKI